MSDGPRRPGLGCPQEHNEGTPSSRMCDIRVRGRGRPVRASPEDRNVTPTIIAVSYPDGVKYTATVLVLGPSGPSLGLELSSSRSSARPLCATRAVGHPRCSGTRSSLTVSGPPPSDGGARASPPCTSAGRVLVLELELLTGWVSVRAGLNTSILTLMLINLPVY